MNLNQYRQNIRSMNREKILVLNDMGGGADER